MIGGLGWLELLTLIVLIVLIILIVVVVPLVLAWMLIRSDSPQAPPPSAAPPRRTADRVRELESLRDEGLITAEEYEELRASILEEL